MDYWSTDWDDDDDDEDDDEDDEDEDEEDERLRLNLFQKRRIRMPTTHKQQTVARA